MVRSGDLMLAALARLLHAVHEDDSLADERQEMRAVEASPAPLRHLEELVGHQQSFVREPAPFVTRWRSRTVANGDSITLDVRRCFQCSAGKSKKVRSTSASCSSVVTAFASWRCIRGQTA